MPFELYKIFNSNCLSVLKTAYWKMAPAKGWVAMGLSKGTAPFKCVLFTHKNTVWGSFLKLDWGVEHEWQSREKKQPEESG